MPKGSVFAHLRRKRIIDGDSKVDHLHIFDQYGGRRLVEGQSKKAVHEATHEVSFKLLFKARALCLIECPHHLSCDWTAGSVVGWLGSCDPFDEDVL